MDKNKQTLFTGTYGLKSRFQALLMPARDRLVTQGYSPNQITIVTTLLCMVYACLLVWPATANACLLMLPVFLLLRMALNALDGMIATKTHTKTALGTVLNEVGDVISDLFLFGAFIFILPAADWLWLLLMTLNLLIEFVSLALFMATGERPVLGPFSKSDRALYLGILSLLLVGFAGNSMVITYYIGIGILLALLTIWNRIESLVRTGN
ncbi:MAG: CDP-alcohol phosphatidyltransferase family protein [Thioalkalispiraceae bacterium]|jgi:CDP-diacylglycerol--glycerol-3-phosphate 3-phosphatidyltransferase